MSKVWICENCGNTERFVAYGAFPVRCIVSGDGETILEEEVLTDSSPEPDLPEECAECGGWHITRVDKEEINDDNNEFVKRR